MLTGLLSNFGYALGADLFEPATDNAKGFFEDRHIVFQNDQFFEGKVSMILHARWSRI